MCVRLWSRLEGEALKIVEIFQLRAVFKKVFTSTSDKCWNFQKQVECPLVIEEGAHSSSWPPLWDENLNPVG